MKKRLAAVALLIGILCMAFGDLTAVAQTTGGSTKAVANVVLLAKFAGDTDTLFDQPKTREDLYDLYNGSRPRSFASYLRTVSYGQLEVKTVFPQDNGDKFIPYTLHVTREQAQAADIDVDILQDILQNVPIDSSLLVDGDGDGVVDNLTVLMQGAGGDRGEGITTTVSHKANYPGVLTVAGGKQVSAYNMVMSDQVYDGAMTSSTGTIIHEFLHTMGYPDLYASDGTAYVGQWDIMASTSTFVQWPLAYLRQAISGWIDVETLTTTQEITLDEQSDAGGTQAYILRSPLSATEFFVVEYRRQGDDIASSLDYKIGGSGIIVYRVNTSVEGLSNFHGANGVYVFRAQSGYDTEALALYRGAHLSAESGRTSIGTSDMGKSLADGALTFSDGTNSGIVISEVGSAGGSSITATVTFPEIDQKDIWTPVFSGSEPADRTSVIAADGALYAASCQYGGSIAVQRFDGTSWSSLGTPGKGDAPQCAVYGGQLYIAFRDQSSGTVKVKRYTGTSFTEVGFGVGGVNSFDLYGDADGLYLAYDVDSQSMHLAVYDPGLQSFKSDGSPVFTGLCGQPQVQSINGTVYVQLRSAAGASQLATFSRQADGSYCEAGDRQAGDMMASCAGDGSLYRAFRDQSAVYVQHFDGTVWQTVGAPIRAQNVMDIGITCHAGQPYVAFSDAGADKTLVYTANSQNDWYQFGLPVDAASGEIDLAVLGNTVYAGYSLSAKQQFQIKEKSAAVQASGITVVPPAKLEYKVGEAADYTGMKVSLQRIGAGDVEVPLGSCTITGFDTSAAGQKTVTVTYLGYQSTFAITVHARTAVSLQVSSAEPIVLYQGQTADISRLKVAVMYGDGSSEELPIASCQVSGYDSITVGPRQGTVAYQGVTGQFSYLVKANLLERIEASPTSGALHFAYGAKFDDTRIRVIGHYSNGSTQVIAAGRYTISGFSSKIAGDHTLTISCGGKTTTLSYRIDQPPAFQITSGSASSSTVDPANGGSLTCKFTINRAATCAVQVWSTTGFVGYASGNRSFPAGSSTVSWAVPRDLKDGKYSFRVVSVQNGREVDRWIDFTAKSTPFSITGGSTSTSTVDPSQGGSLTCKFTINRAATCAVQVWSTTGFVGYASGNRSFPAGSSTVSWAVPRDLKDGKYSFRIVSVQNGREVDRWIDFTAKSTPFSITGGSTSTSTVDPSQGGSLTCKFTINRAATCAVQVWSTTGFVGYASGNRSFPAGSSTVSWAVPRDLKDGKYSFRIVSVQNGREVDRWIDFTAKSTPFSITGGSTSTSTVDPSQGGSLTCKFTINRAATCAVQVWSTTGFVGYASGNRSFPAGSSTVSWAVPRDLKDGKYSFRIVSVQNGREVDRWIDFTAKSTPFSITGGSTSTSTVDPSQGGSLTCKFTINRAATCAVQVWSMTGFVGYASGNRSFPAGSSTVSWAVPRDLKDGKYSFRIVSVQNGREVDRWIDFTAKSTPFSITGGSTSTSTVDPSQGGSLTCKFTINRAATCAVQVWSTTGFVGYASGNRSFPAGSSTVSWAVPRDLKDGKYSFRIVSVQNGREVDRWVDFTAKSTPFSITGGSTSTSTVDPSQGGSLTCKFTINKAATCAVQVWSTTGFVGYASGNRSFPAGSSTVSWTVPRDLKDGKYSFRVVSVQDGREVDRWIDFTAKR